MQTAIEQTTENTFVIHGDLIFTTVGAIYEQHNLLFSNADSGNKTKGIEISLAGVERADSSGLALVIEWLRCARKLNQPLIFTHVPQQIIDLAKLSSLDDLFNRFKD